MGILRENERDQGDRVEEGNEGQDDQSMLYAWVKIPQLYHMK
jgi:hypothetical protein